VKAIRIFIDTTGWIPNYTNSKIEEEYADFKMPR
jgi:cupin superfamily acireductone dioxygenase involved in methionine salvage